MIRIILVRMLEESMHTATSWLRATRASTTATRLPTAIQLILSTDLRPFTTRKFKAHDGRHGLLKRRLAEGLHWVWKLQWCSSVKVTLVFGISHSMQGRRMDVDGRFFIGAGARNQRRQSQVCKFDPAYGNGKHILQADQNMEFACRDVLNGTPQ
jgi:hypothetical protein